MTSIEFLDYQSLSEQAAQMVIDTLSDKPEALLCFASGDTPRGLLAQLVKHYRAGTVDFSRASYVGLDEWVGMNRHDAGSCADLLYHEFLDLVNFLPENTAFFDGKSGNLNAECRRINRFVRERSAIDILVLGIGMNGHLGLNEPGLSWRTYSRVTDLAPVTKSVAQKYFEDQTTLSQGITLGVRHFREAEKVLLMLSGAKKTPVLQKLQQGDIDPNFTATAMHLHDNTFLLYDRAAGGEGLEV